MSYAAAAALQKAVFGALQASGDLHNVVDGAVFDQPPSGSVPALYVTLGPEKVSDRSDGTAHGARHEFVVSVVSESGGFGAAKTVAALISDLLQGADLTLERGELVGLHFIKATARRVSGIRRIDLTFRARVDAI